MYQSAEDSFKEIDGNVSVLIESIKKSEEYNHYMDCLERLKSNPELYAQVCDYRRRNFELQNSEDNRNLYDQVMRFRAENSALRRNAQVNEFLQAELGFCRMMRDINNRLMSGIEFDIEFLN